MSALCSARLVSPLLRLLTSRQADLDIVPNALRSAAPDDRVPVDVLHETLERAAEHFGDGHLGLKLGSGMCFGEVGPFDYLLRSAPTARDAVEAAGRYSRLQADGYRIVYESWRGGGLIRLFDETSWLRTVADMAMSVGYRLHVGERKPFISRMECWFPYAAPRDASLHARYFPGAALRFNAPFYAFAVDDSYQRAPQPAADPLLHALLRERLDTMLGDVARASMLRHRVRRTIEHQIRQASDASAPVVARTLHMSRRTLSRKLQEEGTTFAEELESVRQSLALTYVCESERPFSEIAFLLGFAHVESFHRAFKRWTGSTPLARRAAAAEGRSLTPEAQGRVAAAR